MNTTPPLTVCRLWQRTSAAGRNYLTGRLGSLRVLIFENTGEGDHSHNLCFGQAEDRPAQQQAPQRPDLDAAQQPASDVRALPQQTASDVTASPPPARRYQPRDDASASLAPDVGAAPPRAQRFPAGNAAAPRTGAKVPMGESDEIPF
jgi:hypothetical protein